MKKRFLLFIISIAVFFVGFFNSKFYKDTKINIILESNSYAYLPEVAKDYVREVYENTGEVILTEKNKEPSRPYLNPQYVDYLTLSMAEKESVSLVPDVYTLDFVFNKSYNNQSVLPSSYDSRNVDGKNYITDVRDQKNLNICWTFAATETAETYLLATNKETVTSNSQIFSERQLDYATSNDGIKDYVSEYRSYYDRKLGGGGNFFVATTALANGIALADKTWKSYDDTDFSQMELYEVLNYNKSLYELNTSIYMPRLNVLDLDMSNEENVKLREQYINIVKANIMKYGSAFVGTGSPNYSDGCSYYDSTLNNYVISVDKTCSLKEHAMQIIGWDDNISYSYCADDASRHTTSVSCNNKISGKGVWILRNSWGTDKSNSYPYPYLTYDSHDSDISFITDMDSASEKKWDNNYVLGDAFSFDLYSAKNYTLDVNNNEKLSKLKFTSFSQDATYNIYIAVDGKTLNETFKITNSQPGLVMFDFTDKNITFKNEIKVRIAGQNGSGFLDQVYLFTSNVDKTPILTFDTDNSLIIDKTNLRLYASTKNIASDSEIIYKLYNKANDDMTDKMTYDNNVVAENNINTSITFDSTLQKGDYKIDAIYDGKVLDSIYIINDISGAGTEDDPYVITNSTQLYDMRNDLDAYYILGNDIDLTEDTRSGGKYYNDGSGWVGAWKFSGTLDGKGHSIKGAYISKHNYTSGGYGLFRSLAGNVTIKNLVIDGFDMTCSYWCGAVAGIYGDDLGFDPEDGNNNININNIVIKNTNINGYTDVQNHRIGGIIGGIFASNSDVNISNIYMGANVNFEYGNVVMSGVTRDIKGGASLIRNVHANNFVMRNIQVNGEVKRPEVLVDDFVVNNNVQEYIVNTADKTVDLAKLTDRNTYKDWLNFEDNWIMKTHDDGIARIPILKIAEEDFEYTSIDDISVELTTSEYPSIYDYIHPDTSFANRVSYVVNGEHIILMNNDIIKPISPGTDTIHVKSYYDGYERDIKVNVTHSSQNPYYVVVFDPNGVNKNITSTVFNIRSGGNNLTENPYTKYNYDFVGWNTKADGSGTNYDDKEKITPDVKSGDVIILYAQWRPKKRTVMFDSNGGTVAVDSMKFDYDGYYEGMPIPIREGYGFDGWWYSDTEIKETTKVSSIDDITVKAKWIENSYTIIYNKNGGLGSEGGYHNYYSLGTVGFDSDIYNCFYFKTGYSFKEWNTKADGTGVSYSVDDTINFTDVLNSVFNLYAIWEPNNYKITFSPNGGVGTMDVQNFKSDDTFNINANTYIREGYKFVGWNTSQNGSGTFYSDKEEISNCMKNIYLYAQWERENVIFEIKDYEYNEVDNIITDIPAFITKSEYLSKFIYDDSYTIEFDLNENYVGTGSKVKIHKDGNLFKELTNVVVGDVNGDGTLSVLDIVKINNHIVDSSKSLVDVYALAGDYDDDRDLSVLDIVKINKIIVGGN